MKLEKLLNILCEKGWKPFYGEIKSKRGVRGNYPCKGVIKIRKNTVFISYRYESGNERITKRKKVQHSIRELTSLSSGLWQFVCENGMVDKQHGYIEELKWWKADDDEEGHDNGEERYSTEYQFWLIESALKDESELEQFLLDNIKIDG